MITVTNEDNMNLMSRYNDNHFDLAIVDPPYGININMNMGKKKGKKKVHDDKKWDGEIPKPEYYKELFRVSKNQIIWGGNYMTEHLYPTGSWIFWDKKVPEGVSFADGELAWTSFTGVLRKIQVTYTGFQGMDEFGKIHPTQKPVKLYKHILNKYANKGYKILDTHLGSGSIAIACEELGFDLTACEIDKDYYKLFKKRFKTHQKLNSNRFF